MLATLHARHPHLLIVPRHDGWAGTLISFRLRRCGASRQSSARSAPNAGARIASATQPSGATCLKCGPSVNNALTSVLGNADLLLLEPGQSSGESREQIRAIQTMALRLNEIMQRFSSLASEMRADEKESQAETEAASQRPGDPSHDAQCMHS